MTSGETLARVVQQLATIVHWTLNGWVAVTNAAGPEGDQLAFSVLPEGIDVAQWAAHMMQQYAILLNGVAHFPSLGANMAKLLVMLMGLSG